MSINLQAIDWYTTIKNYYDKGLYTNEQVAGFVYMFKITRTQYKQITGEEYLVYLNNAYDTGIIDQAYLQSCITKELLTQAEYQVIIAN